MKVSVPSARTSQSPGARARLGARQPWISLAARIVLAGVFAAAGWPKLLDPDGTVRSVRAFRLVPEAFVPAFGYGLPVLELALAALLLAGLLTRPAAAVTAVLLVVFLVGIASAWARGLQIECGCFGSTGTVPANPVPGYIADLVRDVIFLALAAWLVRRPDTPFSADRALGLSR